jgi:hypothetical protein
MIQAAVGLANDVHHPRRYAVERDELLSCLSPWTPDWNNPRPPEPEDMAFVLERFRDYCDGNRELARRERALLFRVRRWHRYRLAVMPESSRLDKWLRDGPENLNAADLPEAPTIRYVAAPPGRLSKFRIRDYLIEGVYAELQTRPCDITDVTTLQASTVWHKPGIRDEHLTAAELRELPDFHLEVRFASPQTRLVRALAESVSAAAGAGAAFARASELRYAVLTLAICGLLEPPFEV